jgi:hypothetical protein
MTERGQLESHPEFAERGVINAPDGTEAHGVAQLIRIHVVAVIDHRHTDNALAAP